MPAKALDDGSQNRVKVPKEIHYIWIGGRIQDKYRDGILSTVRTLRDYRVNLWLSKAMSFDSGAFAHNRLQAKQIGAEFMDIDELVAQSYTPTEKWAMALEWGWRDGDNGGQKPNFGAVSDIIRAVILHVRGGIYIDTDCSVKANLAQFNGVTPFGFQAATGNDLNPTGDKLSNCVMISISSGYFIGYYRQWINDEYGKIQNKGLGPGDLQRRFRGEHGYSRKHVEEKTLFMTGPTALAACGIGALTIRGLDVGAALNGSGAVNDLQGLRINKDHFKIAYDNTWLE